MRSSHTAIVFVKKVKLEYGNHTEHRAYCTVEYSSRALHSHDIRTSTFDIMSIKPGGFDAVMTAAFDYAVSHNTIFEGLRDV